MTNIAIFELKVNTKKAISPHFRRPVDIKKNKLFIKVNV